MPRPEFERTTVKWRGIAVDLADRAHRLGSAALYLSTNAEAKQARKRVQESWRYFRADGTPVAKILPGLTTQVDGKVLRVKRRVPGTGRSNRAQP